MAICILNSPVSPKLSSRQFGSLKHHCKKNYLDLCDVLKKIKHNDLLGFHFSERGRLYVSYKDRWVPARIPVAVVYRKKVKKCDKTINNSKSFSASSSRPAA